ncbi:PIF-1 protein [Chrysodeixis chalcites SNPV TF1-A]|uniref:PIF-1 n=1 Tax=Chrysodeixis chalcites nucleopolyhedrovirus TaxID=320432 RepID=T1QZE8_9ABAC|nr:PIF-1 protein [Chrysodeixis chalcites SNPV TF1-A]AGE61537.1 PIF-1 [Chrysodeixis chalcites nucleopolyhedrovirus]
MYLILAIVILILIVLLLTNYISVLVYADEPVLYPLERFDNSNVPLIEPPSEIILEDNPVSCHSQLTPCTSHQDCDICREGLANCQYFDEPTKITMNDIEYTIQPGESYCMALNRERARACNPNTGVWILTRNEIGYSLLCNCTSPGLVTQLNLYSDCNVPVGCQPNGRILNINESPMRCVCDEGFISELDTQTQTPFCRPMRVRDTDYRTFFEQAPCRDGFVSIEHPGLDPIYRQTLRLTSICVVDPCSIDPITGRRTTGRLQYFKNDQDGTELSFCNCPIEDNLFGIASGGASMLRQSRLNRRDNISIVNSCIQPFNIPIDALHEIQYKFFWGRSDNLLSDDDIFAHVTRHNLSHVRYHRLLQPIPNSILSTIKFSIAYSPHEIFVDSSLKDSIYVRFLKLARRTTQPCFYPGRGRCIVHQPDLCIRRHGTVQVGTAETFTNSWCYFSREGGWIKIWSPATRYPRGQFPVALMVSAVFGVLETKNATTIHICDAIGMVPESQYNNLAQILNTYSNYSV